MSSPRTTRQIALRGVLIALSVAAVIGLIVGATATFMGGTLNDAIKAAAVIALVYLSLNLLILAVGLLFKASGGWDLGAALATPVVVAAIGFGYTLYLAYPLR